MSGHRSATLPEHSGPKGVVRVDLAGLDSIRPEALGVFCFSDVRPLTGAAGYLDWRVCGALSRRLESGVFRGEVGESLLLATDGRLGRQRLFVFGLGDRTGCQAEALRRETRRAFEVMCAAGIREVVFVAPSVPDDAEAERRFSLAVSEELAGRVASVLVGP